MRVIVESLFTALTRRAAIFPDMPAIISGGVSPKVLNNQQLLTDIELLQVSYKGRTFSVLASTWITVLTG